MTRDNAESDEDEDQAGHGTEPGCDDAVDDENTENDESSDDDEEEEPLTFKQCCHGIGRRIVDLKNLTKKIETHTTCRACSENLMTQILREFADWYGSMTANMTAAEAVDPFLESMDKQGRKSRIRLPSHQLDHEVLSGLSSRLTFKCPGMHHHAEGVLERPSHGNKHTFTLTNSSTLERREGERKTSASSHTINNQAGLAMMSIGRTQRHLYTAMAHLNIPVTSDFALGGGATRGYHRSERRVGDAVEAAARESCRRALVLEAAAAREADEGAAAAAAVAGGSSSSSTPPAPTTATFSTLTDGDYRRIAGEMDEEAEEEEREEEEEQEEGGGTMRASKRLSKRARVDYLALEKEVLEAEARSKKPIDVSIDACWPKRSSGRLYNSNSGCETAVGKELRMIVDWETMTKNCDTCERERARARAERKRQPGGCSEQQAGAAAAAAITPTFRASHGCKENHHGLSSKSMESVGAARLANRAWGNGYCWRSVCQDNDSTSRAKLQPSTVETKTGTSAASKIRGELPENHPPIEFYADPNHASRTLGKDAYAAFPNSGQTALIAAEVKKLYSYSIRTSLSEEKTPEESKEAAEAALLHHLFGDHSKCPCSTAEKNSWCPVKNNTNYKPNLPRGKYLGVEHKEKVQALVDKHASVAALSQLKEGRNTQTNEAIHRKYAGVAPKEEPMKSGTYDRRIALAVGYYNDQMEPFLGEVYEVGGLGELSEVQKRMFGSLDWRSERVMGKKKAPAYKRQRKHKQQSASREDVIERRSGEVSYSSGIGLTFVAQSSSSSTTTTTTTTGTAKVPECQNCFRRGHTASFCDLPKEPKARKPKALAVDQKMTLGDVICFWDTETDDKNSYVAQAIDINLQFAKVGGTAQKPELVALPSLEYQSLIKPESPISQGSMEWHKGKGNYTNTMLESESGLRVVAGEAAAAVLAASNAASHNAGDRRVWLFGMNSNSYDMRLMQFGTERITGATWHGMMKEAGVVGVIDLMSLVKKPMIDQLPTLKAAKVNGKSNQGKIYKALFGEELPGAHVAKSDVDGLVRIATKSEEVKAMLLSKEVGSELGAWKKHHDALAERHKYEEAMKKKWREEGSVASPAPTAAAAAPVSTTAATTVEIVAEEDQEGGQTDTTTGRRPGRKRKATHKAQNG